MLSAPLPSLPLAADDADRAQVMTDLQLELAIRRLRQPRASETPWIEDDERFCIDCGDTISSERIAAQPTAVRCVRCLTRLENRGKRQ